MPFDYKQYEQKCSRMTKVELQNEVEHQKDVVATAGAGTGFAVLAIPLTMGLSAVAIGGTAPVIISARKKRAIAQRYLNLALGPTFSAQSPPIRAQDREVVRQHWPSQRLLEQQQQPPAYFTNYSGPDSREKQTYVPVEDVEMDLPPSYDEATLRRMTTMVVRPEAVSSQQASLESSFTMPPALESFGSGAIGESFNGLANDSLGSPGEKDVNVEKSKGKTSASTIAAQESLVNSNGTKRMHGEKHRSWFRESE